jgi:hypothetical protein
MRLRPRRRPGPAVRQSASRSPRRPRRRRRRATLPPPHRPLISPRRRRRIGLRLHLPRRRLPRRPHPRRRLLRRLRRLLLRRLRHHRRPRRPPARSPATGTATRSANTPDRRDTTSDAVRLLANARLAEEVRSQVGREARVIAGDRDVARQHQDDHEQETNESEDSARREGARAPGRSNLRPWKDRIRGRLALPASIGERHGAQLSSGAGPAVNAWLRSPVSRCDA